MEIFYITGNEGKFLEVKNLMPSIKRLSIDLAEIQSLNTSEIAQKKAEEGYKISHVKHLVVDDASLYLEALNYKLPGPLVKWFLTSVGSRGLFNLSNSYKKYGAKAVCTLCYRNENGKFKIFKGTVTGKIVPPKVNSFKHWNGIFIPEGENIPFADMSLDRKNRLSHRSIAVRKLKRYLMS